MGAGGWGWGWPPSGATARVPPRLSLHRDPWAALVSLPLSLGTSSVVWALLPGLRASGCEPQLLLVESGKGSVSAERASVSSLSVSAPDELADVVAWAKLRTQMPAPCHSQAGSIPVTCHLLLSPQASVNVGTSVQRKQGPTSPPGQNVSLHLRRQRALLPASGAQDHRMVRAECTAVKTAVLVTAGALTSSSIHPDTSTDTGRAQNCLSPEDTTDK
ncbi:uncharacterized protein LOC141579539 isoform X1 [Camelus bactrianus]|uniref:Uncharacterized protein LOC141579539 isoform X1 n=1 Tax=Camelus bactrianus TaxID=9837 RepID=A0AC58RC05_CAMBA